MASSNTRRCDRVGRRRLDSAWGRLRRAERCAMHGAFLVPPKAGGSALRAEAARRRDRRARDRRCACTCRSVLVAWRHGGRERGPWHLAGIHGLMRHRDGGAADTASRRQGAGAVAVKANAPKAPTTMTIRTLWTKAWPVRTLVLSNQRIALRVRGITTTCTRGDVLHCRIEWNSGTPHRGLKRTRFDRWSISLCDRAGCVVLTVPNAQDFGVRRIQRLRGVLAVPWSTPDDWILAQQRGYTYGLPGGLG